MSVIRADAAGHSDGRGNADGEKVVIRRLPSHFASIVEEFAGEDEQRWKALACLTLNTNGWSMEQIGRVFDHNKGHVSRLVQQVLQELREQYGPMDPPKRGLAGAG